MYVDSEARRVDGNLIRHPMTVLELRDPYATSTVIAGDERRRNLRGCRGQ